MIVVHKYNDGIAYFTCCETPYKYNFANLLSDDCVIDVDLVCPNCGQTYVLYVLKCGNAAIAKELGAQLEVLKLRRKVVEDNGYKDNEQNQTYAE